MDKVKVLEKIKLFVLDMDGTFYLSDGLIPGSLEFLDMVKNSGREWIFFTNNSSKDKQLYVEKVAKMGLTITKDQIMTSGDVTIRFLNENYGGKSVYLVGTPPLERSFVEGGVRLTNGTDEVPDIVVLAFDMTLTYEKLERACTYIRNGATYIATHPDINCPVTGGFIPDCGAMIACVNLSTGKTPRILGKPNKETMDMVVSATGYKPEEIAFVGDRLYTDVATGVKNGGVGLLVLSGEATEEDIKTSDVKPDGVYQNIYEIGTLLK